MENIFLTVLKKADIAEYLQFLAVQGQAGIYSKGAGLCRLDAQVGEQTLPDRVAAIAGAKRRRYKDRSLR